MPERLKDRAWRMNNLYWITDAQGNRIQFRMNPVQLQLYATLWYMSLILKSRQHGITTFMCILFLDACLFNSNVRAGIIAHNREDAQTFFRDKVKFAYDNLPDTIRAARPATQDSAREILFDNNSSIRVGTSMRSGTLQYLHVSELGKISRKYPDKAQEIKKGSLNTVHAGQFVGIESTAEGNDGLFYDLCKDAQKAQKLGSKLTPLDFRFFFFPWYQDERNELDPDGVIIEKPLQTYFSELKNKHSIELSSRQEAWYAKKWSVQGEDMKQEHPSTPQEAFEASIEGAYFASQFNKIYKEGRITQVPYDPALPVHTFWDLGMDDTTAIWFMQEHGEELRLFDFYQHSGEGLGHYAKMLDDRGYNYGNHYAPHDIKVRELGSGNKRIDTAKEHGIYFKVAPRLGKQDQIEAARKVLNDCWFDEGKCADGIKALENYRKEWDEKNGCWRSTPLHNWASNPADALMILATGYKSGGGTLSGLDRSKMHE